MDIPSLLNLSLAKVASLMKGKPLEQLNGILITGTNLPKENPDTDMKTTPEESRNVVIHTEPAESKQ